MELGTFNYTYFLKKLVIAVLCITVKDTLSRKSLLSYFKLTYLLIPISYPLQLIVCKHSGSVQC